MALEFEMTDIRPMSYYLGLEVKKLEEVIRLMEAAPTTTHMKVTKRILRYLKGTLDYGLFYFSSNNFKLFGFCDNDFAGDIDDRKSTSRFIFFMGDCAFTWSSKKQLICHTFNI
ncbi:secreted RxLR effector protein 161-like [Cicer arietinum]|uniref:Uncharacterized protein LOC113787720 n=1 Tax=Cicer arietinum TaxID=3827 RepID=A0A3Q7XGJ7_CICAR|nr:uncharacterized protein LOC113787720 [Cicer arietinum]